MCSGVGSLAVSLFGGNGKGRHTIKATAAQPSPRRPSVAAAAWSPSSREAWQLAPSALVSPSNACSTRGGPSPCHKDSPSLERSPESKQADKPPALGLNESVASAACVAASNAVVENCHEGRPPRPRRCSAPSTLEVRPFQALPVAEKHRGDRQRIRAASYDASACAQQQKLAVLPLSCSAITNSSIDVAAILPPTRVSNENRRNLSVRRPESQGTASRSPVGSRTNSSSSSAERRRPRGLLEAPTAAAHSKWQTSPWRAAGAPKDALALPIAAAVSYAEDANSEYRSHMEDGHIVADPLQVRSQENEWSLFCVLDGHGGRQAVDYCEERLHVAVSDELAARSAEVTASDDSGKLGEDALVAAFSKVDAELALNGAWRTGCTATVALLHRHSAAQSTLHIANVGDSRALLLGAGEVLQVSVDHRACNPSEATRVRAAGNFVRNGRVGGSLSVSRALGDHYLKPGVSCDPSVYTCRFDGARALVIASDGLWDAVADDEVQSVVEAAVDRAIAVGVSETTNGETIELHVARRLQQDAAKALVERAQERGSKDNISALVVFL